MHCMYYNINSQQNKGVCAQSLYNLHYVGYVKIWEIHQKEHFVYKP